MSTQLLFWSNKTNHHHRCAIYLLKCSNKTQSSILGVRSICRNQAGFDLSVLHDQAILPLAGFVSDIFLSNCVRNMCFFMTFASAGKTAAAIRLAHCFARSFHFRPCAWSVSSWRNLQRARQRRLHRQPSCGSPVTYRVRDEIWSSWCWSDSLSSRHFNYSASDALLKSCHI